MDDEARKARTAALAHQIWEAEGRPDGHQQRHWQMAERLVQADLDAAYTGTDEEDAGRGPA